MGLSMILMLGGYVGSWGLHERVMDEYVREDRSPHRKAAQRPSLVENQDLVKNYLKSLEKIESGSR